MGESSSQVQGHFFTLRTVEQTGLSSLALNINIVELNKTMSICEAPCRKGPDDKILTYAFFYIL